MASFLKPLADSTATLVLRNQRTGTIVADRLLPALDSASRRTGLLKHTGLSDREAMLIAPTNAIHTFFMKFPIDVAFVTRDGAILKICAAMPAWRIAAAWRAHGVVEMAAGAMARTGTRVGDRLLIVGPQDM
jgi:uncharacterized membrane protein (UPF0127 family)